MKSKWLFVLVPILLLATLCYQLRNVSGEPQTHKSVTVQGENREGSLVRVAARSEHEKTARVQQEQQPPKIALQKRLNAPIESYRDRGSSLGTTNRTQTVLKSPISFNNQSPLAWSGARTGVEADRIFFESTTSVREALQKLLLTLEETTAILGQGWMMETTGKLGDESSGFISAAIVYRKSGEHRGEVFEFTEAFLEFDDAQTALTFLSGQPFKNLFLNPILPTADDPKLANIKNGLHVGAADKKGADNATYATLPQWSESLIAFVKDKRIYFVRGNLKLIEELLPLAQKQLDILVNGRP